MRARSRLIAAVCLLALTTIGCRSREQGAGQAASLLQGYSPIDSQPVSDSETNAAWPSIESRSELVQVLKEAALTQDTHTLRDLIDIETLCAQAVAALPPSHRGQAEREFRNRLDKPAFYLQLFCHDDPNTAPLEFVKYRQWEGKLIAQFRISTPGRFDYVECLVENKGETAVITDIYHYNEGRSLSGLIRTAIEENEALIASNWVQKLTPQYRKAKADFDTVKRIDEAIKTQQGATALRLIKTLPATTQESFKLLALRFDAARLTGNHELMEKTLERYRVLYPTDTKAVMLSMQLHLNRNESDHLLEDINALDEYAGGDAYLNLLRSTIYWGMGNRDVAVQLMQFVVSQFPNSAKAQELLADMLLDMGRYEELYQLLVRYESRFEIDLSDLANLP
ncbi:MAG: hypothetical protein KDA37_15265, partial [Planctomycetales bacterium]|nr:hypothetical protein [Planctomycetales bacterium]